ncbi:MAG: AraC family transcriptional regulator [Ruminococcaceae bacterium]|nr:AraC family transcriptional regulator [Oscillospiraceae bacterium]
MRKNCTLMLKSFKFSHRCNEPNENLSTRHCHNEYEILYVVEGNGRYLIEGAEFELKPRTLVFIRPFEYHCVEVDSNSVYDRYVLHFSDSFTVKEISDVLKKLTGDSDESSGMFYSPDSIPQNVVSVFDRFEEGIHLPDTEKELYYKLILSEMLILLSSLGNQKIAHDECELGARVARYINEYLEKNVSLDVIAKKFFVSKYYLCRAFKKYSGVSIHSYITHKRVVYAKQLIESGETASGAAYKVGFGDYSAFYRAYIKVLGKSPTSK